VLAELSARLGKHRAQELMQAALAGGGDLVAALAAAGAATAEEVADWAARPAVDTAGAMVDAVVARGTP
jgi:hypothetical protein